MEKSYSKKRSAVNLCLNNLVKSIKCDHPCSEGYEVGNLISKNFLERNQGFLVERFIKPPVTITFEFTCEIDLKYLTVQCNVGAQKSSGVELSIQPYSSKNQYESVCSGVLKGNEKGFVFHRYSENVKAKFGEEYCFCSFKSARNLSAVKSASIKIFRTQGASVPALGKVDIWGVPRKVLPQIENSVQSQNYSHRPTTGKDNEIKPSWPSLNLSSEQKSFSFQCGLSKRLKVPEDFIDPITCDVMCQPLTLPSGKVIDVSTLELYEKAESQWGRSPSDPFTGIPFTSSSKPIAASDLKARIDKFLCDNSNHPEIKKIPRTIGRSLAPSQKLAIRPSVSKLITDKEQISSYSVTNNSMHTNISYCEIPVKRRKVKENGNQDSHIQSGSSKRETLAQTNTFKTSPVPPAKKPTTISFQERMEKSLELSLKSTLSSLPSFTTDDKESDEKPLAECNVCKLSDNLFSIPCCHFICRNCLISFQTKELLCCLLCKSSFKSHNVQKVHISK